jgi:hypothetical protein
MRIEMTQFEYEDLLACAQQARELQVTVVKTLNDDLLVVEVEPSAYNIIKQWGIL